MSLYIEGVKIFAGNWINMLEFEILNILPLKLLGIFRVVIIYGQYDNFVGQKKSQFFIK